MKVLGIYGSPRKGGNSDLLLDRALEGSVEAGADVEKIRARELAISGCRECGGCDATGKCVVRDDMQDVYPLLERVEAIIMATPIFFYGMPSRLKALIDRCQAKWMGRLLDKSPERRKEYDSGRGYLIAVGATRGKNLFLGVELTAKYFFDALDMGYEEGFLIRNIDGKGDIIEHEDLMEGAFEFGRMVAEER